MLSDMTSSLPIEYQLEYGTACRNIDDANLVSEPPIHCVFSDNIRARIAMVAELIDEFGGWP